jgi:hypothetical protein
MAFKKLERRVDRLLCVWEKILLRVLLFACFIHEVSKFAGWLMRN